MITVEFDILNLCNLNCWYCYNHEIYDTKIIVSKQKLDLIFKRFRNSKHDIQLDILGGEPTLHPKFDYIMNLVNITDTIKECGIYTNGLYKRISVPNKEFIINFSYHVHMNEHQEKLWFRNLDSAISEFGKEHIEIILIIHNFNKFHTKYEHVIDLYNDKVNISINPVHVKNHSIEYCNIKTNHSHIYRINNEFLSYYDLVQRGLNRFKGKKCLITGFHLYADGTISANCCGQPHDLAKEDFFRELKLKEIECPFDSCDTPTKLECTWFKD